MIGKVFKDAFAVLAKKPLRLWGTSILASILSVLIFFLFSGFGITLGIALVINTILSVGLSMVYLHGYRGEQVEPYQLFDGFKSGKTAGRVLKGMLYKDLMVVLWCIIPIVGPFIAIYRSYQYCLTPYILVDEEEGNPFEVYKESANRTRGHCGQILLADIIICAPVLLINIIGGVILGALTPSYSYDYYTGRLVEHGSQAGFIIFMIFFGLISLVIGIIVPLVAGLVHAAFFEELTAMYNNGGAQGYQQPAYGAGYQDPYAGGYQQPQYQDPNAAYQQPPYQDPNAYQQQPPYQPPYQGQ
jgi:uncharacterized membrane protein